MSPYLALAFTSVLVLIVVFALIREVRLRRALERLLFRLLALWRDRNAQSK